MTLLYVDDIYPTFSRCEGKAAQSSNNGGTVICYLLDDFRRMDNRQESYDILCVFYKFDG